MPRIILKREPKYLKKHEAFPFQEEAVNALCDLEYGAIFHEQGLGKTKIAFDLMLYWFEKRMIDTVLLIVKKTLLNNWIREFKIHTHIKPKILSQNRKLNYYVFNSPARVILTNYEVIRSELKRIELFLKTRDVAAILDESAKIKNPESSLTKAFLQIANLFKKRFILTGTPIANRPYDIWAQVWFLDQGKSLGNDFESFKRSCNLSNELYKDQKAQQKLEKELVSIYDKTCSFSVRETKSSKIISLPRKVIESIKTDWETHQLELYQQIKNEERALVLKNGIPSEDKADVILKRLVRLIQIASNPSLVDESYFSEPGKLSFLRDLVLSIKSKSEKCIVWTSFIKNANWLQKELEEVGSSKIHGEMPIELRNVTIDEFLNRPEINILVATPGAAKEGLTLTVANHVIFYDRSFGLDDYIQAQDRIHRISQKKTCFVHNLIMNESIDEWVDILLYSKQLAAQLAQGDISIEYYKNKMSYSFGEVIKSILHIN